MFFGWYRVMLKKNNTAILLVIMIMIVAMLTTCRKEEPIVISGKVFDPNQEIPVDQVRVELWTQLIEGGIFSANYTLAETTTTVNDGTFSFNLVKKNYTGIRLSFSKTGYFGWESDLNMDKINNQNSHFADYQLLPKAWLHIRVKNAEPVGSDDYFEFRILNGYTGCEDCCKGEKYQFTGYEIDQTLDCQTSGHQLVMIQWSKRKNGEQIIRTESFFIPAFQTTDINFNY